MMKKKFITGLSCALVMASVLALPTVAHATADGPDVQDTRTITQYSNGIATTVTAEVSVESRKVTSIVFGTKQYKGWISVTKADKSIAYLYTEDGIHVSQIDQGITGVVYSFDKNTGEYTGTMNALLDMVHQDNLIKSEQTSPGWHFQYNSWYYLGRHGESILGWTKIEGKWYNFSYETGKMMTGWIKDNGTWYYLNDNGAMATGWVKNAGKWYFLNNDGSMKTGWLSDGGKWYYLNPSSGAMSTGWLKADGKWYFLRNTGAMQTAMFKLAGVLYKVDASGVCTW